MGGLGLIGAALGVGMLFRVGLLQRDASRMRRVCRRLAASFGIEIGRTPSLFDRTMDGRIGAHRVRVTSPSINYLRLEISPARALPYALRIASRSWGEVGRKSGDDELDLRFVATGPALFVAAVLSERTRALLRSVREGRVIVSGGSIVVDGFWGEWPEVELERVLGEMLRIAIELAELLAIDGESCWEIVLSHLRQDGDPRVRLENLLLLLDSAELEVLERAVELALADRDPGIRLCAAERASKLDRISEGDALAAIAGWDRDDIVIPALKHLAAVGTLGAIEGLRSRERAIGQSRLLRDTIAAIQARCGTAGDGHLSIAEEKGGQVSLTGGGSLSLPEDR